MTDHLAERPEPTAARTTQTARASRLARVLGPGAATLLTLSCITPASSLFIIVPELLPQQGTGVVLALVAGVIVSAAVGCCYAELGTRTPSSGGEYAMVTHTLGRLTGWLTFVLCIALLVVIPPIIALGTADYLADLLTLDRATAGAGVMLLATATAILDIKSNAVVTSVFLALEVVAAAVVAGLGFAHAQRNPVELVVPHVAAGDGGTAPFTLAILVSGLAVAMFVVNGFGTASYLAEEIHDPRRNVAKAVFWSLGLAAVVIVVPTIATVLGVADVHTLATGNFSGFVREWGGDGVAVAVNVGIAVAILNAVIVMVLQNGRVIYASARDRAWPDPVNRALTHIHPRFRSPWVSTLVVSIPGAVMAWTVDIESLLGITSVIVSVIYVALAVGALAVRRQGSMPGWRMPLWPLPPLLVIGAIGYALLGSAPVDLWITAGIVVVALVYYAGYLAPRRGDRFVVQAPVEE
ncbi:MAG TPA: APC family permease [Nocardioides sp.]|nr:APC family permease [uncultured Nocardioides sp.]HEX5988034.1 APC family permease [Nocardioides sp.]